MSDAHRISDPAFVREFMLAGNAVFTLRSKRTGTRFTYRIRKPDEGKPHFVGVLTGVDNHSSYTFLGSIFRETEYRLGQRSKIAFDAPSARAFSWFWKALSRNVLHPKLEVWHEGTCGRCGRKLTVPESIASGLGPECARRRKHKREPLPAQERELDYEHEKELDQLYELDGWGNS